MNILSNIKILYKFIIGFILVILVVGAAGVYSELANQEISQKIIKHSNLIGFSQSLVEHVQDSFNLMEQYLLVENTAELETLKPKIANSIFVSHQAIKKLQDQNVDSYLLGLIDKYVQTASEASSQLTYSHDLRLGLEVSESKDDKSTQSKIASLKIAERNNLAIIQDAQFKTSDVMDEIIVSSRKTFEETQTYAQGVQQLTWIILILGIVLSMIISILISGMILKPVDNLKNVALKIAEGDLTKRANAGSKDEIGYLAGVFNQMLDHLNQSAKQLGESNKELEEKLSELQKFKELTVGRELKMIELKTEIKKLQGVDKNG